jgi:hypothetical protein
VEEGRINELENKFSILTDDYVRVVEENKMMRKQEMENKKEAMNLIKGRDNFKE